MNTFVSLLSRNKQSILAIGITVLTAILTTAWAIYGLQKYGIALFILMPLFIGFSSTFIYGFKRNISLGKSLKISLLTIAIYSFILLFFALEGLICILMAAPIGLILACFGSFLAYFSLKKFPAKTNILFLLILLSIPLVGYIENPNSPQLIKVQTSIVISASPEKVWTNIIEFPQLGAPQELLFKAGIAYPISANIEGKGVGAVRHCNFSTGSFVEPITTWEEPKLLQFDVWESPAPMKELSFWDIDAPHLHDYFISKKDQFKLTRLNNSQTLLEGTTWYYHKIQPAIYWQLWSNFIIHKIHTRVLSHIKNESEKVH